MTDPTPKRLSDEEIAELERLEHAVTPAPWRYEIPDDGELVPTIEPNVMWIDMDRDASHPALGLMIEARNALPSLLAEVRAARAAGRPTNERFDAAFAAVVMTAPRDAVRTVADEIEGLRKQVAGMEDECLQQARRADDLALRRIERPSREEVERLIADVGWAAAGIRGVGYTREVRTTIDRALSALGYGEDGG